MPTTKILVAEDNLINQKVVFGMLEKLGYEVDIVTNGEEVLAAIKLNDYALIFMDCHMPVMNGYLTTEAIRKSSTHCELVVIALTANAMPGDEEKCLKSGMNGYLPKPLNFEAIKSTLDQHLPKT